jgi:prolipoprotein diacylglyceryltransferase
MIKALWEAGLIGIASTVYTYLILLIELLFGLWLARKMSIKLWKALVILVSGYAIRRILVPLTLAVETALIGQYAGVALTRIFLFTIPLYMLVFRLLKIDRNRGFDFVGLVLILVQAMAHIGCVFTGCCCGETTEVPLLWNPELQRYVFPANVFESLTTFAIFAIMLICFKKKRMNTGGIMYACLLLGHGFARLFWDYFRTGPDVVIGLSILQLWALLLIIGGGVWIYLYLLKKEREELRAKHGPRIHKKKKR